VLIVVAEYRKGAVLSEVTAEKEYGVPRDFIVKGIQTGKLEYRDGAVWGNPYLRVLRSQLELYIEKIARAAPVMRRLRNSMKTSALTPPFSLIMNRIWPLEVIAEIRLIVPRSHSSSENIGALRARHNPRMRSGPNIKPHEPLVDGFGTRTPQSLVVG
jgi:hypothetical protein